MTSLSLYKTFHGLQKSSSPKLRKKRMVKKSLLALLFAMGLSVTPRVESLAAELVTLGVVYEFVSLFRTHTRDPKPGKKQRPLLDISRKLFKKDPTQWRKNLWKNLVICQEDYFEGQVFKDTYLKLKRGEFIKASKAKCYPYGFNGNLLSYLAFLTKAQKSMKDFALLALAVASLKGGPKALIDNNHKISLFGKELNFSGFLTYCGWPN